LRVPAASAGASAGGELLLLLEDFTEDRSEGIAATGATSEASLFVGELDADPKWTTVILATGVTSSLWVMHVG